MKRVTNDKYIEIKLTDLRKGWKSAAVYVSPKDAALIIKMLDDERYYEHKGYTAIRKIAQAFKKALEC